MNCPECGTENRGKFCHKCGLRLIPQIEVAVISPELDQRREEKAAIMEPMLNQTVSEEAVIDAEQEGNRGTPSEVVPTPVVERNVDDSSIPNGTRYGLRFVKTYGIMLGSFVLGFIGLMACTVFLLAKYIQRGSFLNELLYHLMRNVWNLPPEQAAYFSVDLQNKYWHQIVLLHGGAYRGTYKSILSSQETGFDFGVHIPLILSLVLLLFMVTSYVFLVRRIVRQYLQSDVARLEWAVGFGLLYALVVTWLAYLLQPKSVFLFGTDRSEIHLFTSYSVVFLSAYIVSFLGCCVGMGRWSFMDSGNWKIWLTSMRNFTLIMVGFSFLISSLMIVQWALEDNSKIYHPNIITMGSVWEEYKQDPAIYAIMPNILIQEQIYALGGTWHIDGIHAARFLGSDVPFQLNLLSGIEAVASKAGKTGQDEILSGLEKDLQVSWYHLAFLLVYAYALSQIKLQNLVIFVVTTFGIILGIALLSSYVTLDFTVTGREASEGMIGFGSLQTGMTLGVGTLAFLSLSYISQLLMGVRTGKVIVNA